MGKGEGMRQLQSFIEGELKRQDMSPTQLAARADLSHSVVSRLLKPGNPAEPELGTLNKLADALRVKRWQLVQILDGDDRGHEMRARAIADRIASLPVGLQEAVDAFLASIEGQSKKPR